MRFCLDDGTALVDGGAAQAVAAATALLPTPGDLPATMTAVRPDVPSLSQTLPPTRLWPAGESDAGGASGSGPAIIIGIALTAVFILSLLGFGLTGLVFAQRIPMIVLCLVGMVVAMLRAKKHPKASLIAGLSLAFYLFLSFGYTTITYYFPRMAHLGRSEYQFFFTVARVLVSIGYAVVIVLLVAAAFAGRKSPPVGNN